MNKIKILFIGAEQKTADIVVRLINSNPLWQASSALNAEDAILKFNQENFILVLFGAGINEHTDKELRKYFSGIKPGILLVQHYGGGSGLLSNEIIQALQSAHM